MPKINRSVSSMNITHNQKIVPTRLYATKALKLKKVPELGARL